MGSIRNKNLNTSACSFIWWCDMVGHVRWCLYCIFLYEFEALSLAGSILCSEYKLCTLWVGSEFSFLDWLMSMSRWERLKSSPRNQNMSIFSLLIFCFTCMNHLHTQKHICKIYFQPHRSTWYTSAYFCRVKNVDWLKITDQTLLEVNCENFIAIHLYHLQSWHYFYH